MKPEIVLGVAVAVRAVALLEAVRAGARGVVGLERSLDGL